ncbi:UNVERIFIED_CONTAM: hypothetical protein Sradi_0894800 [Sesamum radiatum]|uniref:Uncharacterized protein n=1 Tax=Sesamum radiatum TaxID=300843 RepID=A0AAW2V4M7_SESRA
MDCSFSLPENLATTENYYFSSTSSTPKYVSHTPQISASTWKIVRPKGRKRMSTTPSARGRAAEEVAKTVLNDFRRAIVTNESSQPRWVAKKDKNKIRNVGTVSSKDIPLTNTFHVLEAEAEKLECDRVTRTNVAKALEMDDNLIQIQSTSES